MDATLDFYIRGQGMRRVDFTGTDGRTRTASSLGAHMISLHIAGAEIDPHAAHPVPGSADICLLSSQPLEAWQSRHAGLGIVPHTGIVARTGAAGPIRSIYLYDPDGNLIEISNYV